MIEKIINRIIKDIKGRKGIGNEWEMIDEDVINEIKEKWENIIIEELMKNK
jgi:hypothetical protein